MSERIFLAGAAGAIGKRLIPLLVRAGHTVHGTTRSAERGDTIRALGAEPVVVNVFDAAALLRAVVAARPTVVVHQLTDLADLKGPAQLAATLERNARIRKEGTKNLVAAALEAAATRMVAQSVAWVYAGGAKPHRETDALDTGATGTRATTVSGVVALERAVLESPPIAGCVLRYGKLWGPGTGNQTLGGNLTLHVDAAALAAHLAVERRATGIFNVADAPIDVATDRARELLGWSAEFRL